MVNDRVAERVLEAAMKTGGDYAELFMEDRLLNSVKMEDSVIDTAVSSTTHGAGVRIFKGLLSFYATTNDLSEQGLMLCAKKAAQAVGDSSYAANIALAAQQVKNAHVIKVLPENVSYAKKANVVRETERAARLAGGDIAQVVVMMRDWRQDMFIASTDGVCATDRRVYSRIAVNAIASRNGENQSAFSGPGCMRGFEAFEEGEIDYLTAGRKAADNALLMLDAKNCKSGKMTVAIANSGGVLFHEACGHSLEATSVARGESEFSGKLGQQIANKKVTAIDDGTIPNAWGSLNIDDEGTPTQKNVLIEDGVLKGYLIDKLGGRRMRMAPTGSSRRESFIFSPTSRMNNTYIAAGTDRDEDIISSIEYGLYAKEMGGGSVNPATGEFNFSVSVGYMIRNGVIQEPVRGASLIGRGSEILNNIDMVGGSIGVWQGMCGSMSGSVPVNTGQPLIRVSNITVGGME